MLLREKIFLFIAISICIVYLVDFNTQIINKVWQETTGYVGVYSINQGYKIGYINGRGRLAIRPKFDYGVKYFTHGLAPVSIDEKWGFIDTQGKLAIPLKYSKADVFSEGLAVVATPGKFISKSGYIDTGGKFVIDPQFVEAKKFSGGLAGVKIGGKWGYIEKSGDLVIDAQFDEVRSFSGKLAAVRIGAKWGYISEMGAQKIPFAFNSTKDFTYGLAAVEVDEQWGYVDSSGNFVIEPQYAFANQFKEGLAAVGKNKTTSFINTEGEEVIAYDYLAEARDFSEAFAAAKVNAYFDYKSENKWGYINKNGKFVIEPKFDWAWDFQGGLARVGLSKNIVKRGYVNRAGRLIWDPANWERSLYLKKFLWSIMALIILGYLIMLLRFYQVKEKEINIFLREQAKKRNGQLIGGGLFSDPRLLFSCQNTEFMLCFEGVTVLHYQPQISITSNIKVEYDYQVTFYIDLAKNKLASTQFTKHALLEMDNQEFNDLIKIPKSTYDKFIIQLITSDIQKKIMESKALGIKDRMLRLDLSNERLNVYFDKIPKEQNIYDWLIDLTTMFYRQVVVIEEKNENKTS